MDMMPKNQAGLELMAQKGREFMEAHRYNPDSLDDCLAQIQVLRPNTSLDGAMILGQPVDPRNLTHLHAIIRALDLEALTQWIQPS